MMIANIGPVDRPDNSPELVDDYRAAIRAIWQSAPYVLVGPTFDDVVLSEGVHFTTDAEITLLADRWFAALVNAGLPAADFANVPSDAAAYISDSAVETVSAFLEENYQPGASVYLNTAYDWQTARLLSGLMFADATDIYTNYTDVAAAMPTFLWIISNIYTPEIANLESRYAQVVSYRWGPPQYRHRTLTLYARPSDPAQIVLRFGEQFSLVDWRLPTGATIAACETLPVESWWRAPAVPDNNYAATFVLTTTDGAPITQNDNSPADILTGLWQPDRLYFDRRTLTLPCDTAPGDYWLLVGVYDYTTITLLDASYPDGTGVSSPAYLTTITVEAPAG
jgi:hypothetical protein